MHIRLLLTPCIALRGTDPQRLVRNAFKGCYRYVDCAQGRATSFNLPY